MDSHGQLKFLLVMAASDGGLASEELQFLSDRARSLGMSTEEFAKVVDEATGDNIDLKIPETKAERMAILTDVVRMMGADGELHTKEKELFALMAAKMDITSAEVNQIIDSAVQ